MRRWAGALGLEGAELSGELLGRPAELFGGALIAQQGSSPDGSYKELGAEALLAAVVRRGVEEIFLDSSGNAGIAVARAAAARRVGCTVLVPASTPEIKMERIRAAGARVEAIPGDRDATARAAEAWRSRAVYASPFLQPFFQAGVATLAWDLDDQLGGELPGDWLLPVGNGPLLLGMALGFRALRAGERLDRLPRLHAVQLEGYAALYPAGPGVRRESPPIAAGIAIPSPPRRADILAALERSGGDMMRVSEEEIAAARETLREGGFAADPTGAAAFAGFGKRPDLQARRPLVIVTSLEAS